MSLGAPGIVPQSPTFPHSIQSDRPALKLRDRIQIALAIADDTLLRSMLANCQPAIAQSHQIGKITSAICLAAPEHQTVDGIVEYERIECVLPPVQDARDREAVDYGWNARDYSYYTRYQSDSYILATRITVAEAESLLRSAGFSSSQTRQILSMPPSASYKSWWLSSDAAGRFTHPFLRTIRLTQFSNGTVTLKYKDAFAEFEPPCFHSHAAKVLVEIQPQVTHFATTLARINRNRVHQQVELAILIADKVSSFEAEAFNSQGISLYPDIHLTRALQAHCGTCQNDRCALQGYMDSPVTACRDFLPESSLSES